MAITTIPQTLYPYYDGSPAITNLTWNSTNTKFAWVFTAPKSGNIRKVIWRTGTVTTSQVVKVSLQDVDTTTGFPDGTLDQSVTRATIASNTWYTETMGSDRTVTRGDVFCVVFEWDSTAGNTAIVTGSVTTFAQNYLCAFVSGAWQKGLSATNRPFVGYLEYDDGTSEIMPNVYPFTVTNTDFNNGSTPDEQGLYFQSPVSIRVYGASWDGRSGGDLDLVLYDSDGSTVLASKSFDKDVVFGTTSTNNPAIFSSSITLAANTFYRLTVKPTSATNVRINIQVFQSSGLLAISPWSFGVDGYLTTRTDAGAWTQTNTSKPSMFLLVDGIDYGGSSGGAHSMGYFG